MGHLSSLGMQSPNGPGGPAPPTLLSLGFKVAKNRGQLATIQTMWKVKFSPILMIHCHLEVWPANPMATSKPKVCTVPPHTQYDVFHLKWTFHEVKICSSVTVGLTGTAHIFALFWRLYMSCLVNFKVKVSQFYDNYTHQTFVQLTWYLQNLSDIHPLT